MNDTVTPPAPPPEAPPPAPSTPAEASARIATLRGDTTWGQKLFAGDVETVKEFHSLHELAAKGSAVDMAMAGVTRAEFPTTQEHQMIGTADMLKQIGMRPEVARELLEGKGVSAEEFRAVQDWKTRHMSDKGFTDKYLAGDVDARRLMTTANFVIANG